jgi:hypothetical protein
LYALAFSTLLSSQETGAHLRRTLIRFQGNHSTLPGGESLVNSFIRTCWLAILGPTTKSTVTRRPTRTAPAKAAQRKPLRSASWWLPGIVRLPATQSLGARRTLGNREPFVKSNRTTGCYRRSAPRLQRVTGQFCGSRAHRPDLAKVSKWSQTRAAALAARRPRLDDDRPPTPDAPSRRPDRPTPRSATFTAGNLRMPD